LYQWLGHALVQFFCGAKYLADEFTLTANDTGIILGSFQAGYVLVRYYKLAVIN
jgi:hypothetical protein